MLGLKLNYFSKRGHRTPILNPVFSDILQFGMASMENQIY